MRHQRQPSRAYHVEGICNQSQTRDVVADAQLDEEKDGIERHHDADARRLRPALHFDVRWQLSQHSAKRGESDEPEKSRARARTTEMATM